MLLFLIDSQSDSAGYDQRSFLDRVIVDSAAFTTEIKNSDVGRELTANHPSLKAAVMETLRLTAHTIGAVRKVVSPEGWSVWTTGPDGEKTKFTIPGGSYVGATHIVPNLSTEM